MVKDVSYSHHFSAWAGLITGPVAWAISTQLNFALVSWQCVNRVYPVPWIGVLLALVSLAGGLVSLQYRRQADPSETSLRFASLVAALTSLLFMLIILLQGFAGLIFTGCER
jgi:hypothetical protein